MLEVKYTEVVEKINSFLSEEFEVDQSEITADGNMKEVLDLDSLDYVDLVVVIENNFGIKLKSEDFSKIETFEDFYTYISNRLSGK